VTLAWRPLLSPPAIRHHRRLGSHRHSSSRGSCGGGCKWWWPRGRPDGHGAAANYPRPSPPPLLSLRCGTVCYRRSDNRIAGVVVRRRRLLCCCAAAASRPATGEGVAAGAAVPEQGPARPRLSGPEEET
jgi:hypothetical protein